MLHAGIEKTMKDAHISTFYTNLSFSAYLMATDALKSHHIPKTPYPNH